MASVAVLERQALVLPRLWVINTPRLAQSDGHPLGNTSPATGPCGHHRCHWRRRGNVSCWQRMPNRWRNAVGWLIPASCAPQNQTCYGYHPGQRNGHSTKWPPPDSSHVSVVSNSTSFCTALRSPPSQACQQSQSVIFNELLCTSILASTGIIAALAWWHPRAGHACACAPTR